MKKVFKRKIADKLAKFIDTDDIIVLHGARQVGKTSILQWFEEKLKTKGEAVVFFDLEIRRFKELLDAGPEDLERYLVEQGINTKDLKKRCKKVFVLIDEIQYLQNPSNFLKLVADHYRYLKLIVSGSSSFAIKNKFKDSLVGRTVEFEIFNLSFEEFLTFRGYSFVKNKVSASKIKISELSKLYEEYVLYGGYPKIVLTPDLESKEVYLSQIIDTYVRKDIRDLAEIKDVEKFNLLLEALSAQNGQVLNITELANTVGLNRATVERYLFLLEQTYIIRLVRPFSRNRRSEISKMPKIFFFDTGLVGVLWLKSLPRELIGSFFESSVFAELAKKYGPEKIYYWRTKDKKEIDFILNYKGQTITPIEVKMNFAQFRGEVVMKYFFSKYKTAKNYKVVALRGEPDSVNQIYPWQL